MLPRSCITCFFNYFGIVASVSNFNFFNLCSITGNCQENKCIPDAILRKGECLKSSNSTYKFCLRRNGNLVLICGARAMWTSFTINNNVNFLHFNKEGTSLVLCGKNDSTIWRAYESGRGKELVLQDDGKLVVYNYCNKRIWEEGNKKKCRPGLA